MYWKTELLTFVHLSFLEDIHLEILRLVRDYLILNISCILNNVIFYMDSFSDLSTVGFILDHYYLALFLRRANV